MGSASTNALWPPTIEMRSNLCLFAANAVLMTLVIHNVKELA